MSTEFTAMKNKEKALILFDVDDVLFDTKTFIDSGLMTFRLYEEVKESLRALSTMADLGILSQGGGELQTKKLKETEILHMFLPEHTHIIPLKNEETVGNVVNKYNDKTIYYVDDRLPTLSFAKKDHPSLQAIWLRRGRYIDQDLVEGFSPDATIASLSDLVEIIASNPR